MVPTQSARLYTQVFTRHRLLAGMPEFSFPRAAWERGVLEHLRIKTSAEREGTTRLCFGKLLPPISLHPS